MTDQAQAVGGVRVLFLDIDGVLNCEQTKERNQNGTIGIDPVRLVQLRRILDACPDLKVVLSSTWRLFPDLREEVARHVSFIGVTPDRRRGLRDVRGRRGDEVHEWLVFHPEVTRYAILDDDADFLDGQPLFRTTWANGLTRDIGDAVIAYLNEEVA